MNKEHFYLQLQKLNEKYRTQPDERYDTVIAIEELLKEYVKFEPRTTELWLRLAIIQHNPPLYFLDTITAYLDNIFVYDPYNADAHILLAYMSFMNGPGVTQSIFEKICEVQTNNLEKAAMIELMKAWYYRHEKEDYAMYERCLLLAIAYCPTFASHYLSLGEFYARRGHMQEAKRLLKCGLNNVQQILSLSLINDLTDIEEFYNEHLKSTTLSPNQLGHVIRLLESDYETLPHPLWEFERDHEKLYQQLQTLKQTIAAENISH